MLRIFTPLTEALELGEKMKSFGKTIDLLLVILIIILIPKMSGYFALIVRPILGTIDPDRVYIYNSLHHIFQLLFTLIVMKLWINVPLASWGFNFKNYKLSLKIFFWFCLYSSIFHVIYQGAGYYIYGAQLVGHELSFENVVGMLSFQMFLSGAAEEPLFRAFVMIVLSRSWTNIYKVGKIEIPASGVWATLFFMFAHIGIDYTTFTITSINYYQQFLSLGLGLFYAVTFHKTKSLLAPILSHGYSNVMAYVMIYIYVSL